MLYNTFLYTQDVVLMSITRYLNVMDVRRTTKQRCVLTGKILLYMQVIPKKPGLTECCHGRMIDPRVDFCCDFKISPRKHGKNTGCCRLALWKYTMYNKATDICCARELRRRFSKYERGRVNIAKAMSRMSCCNQHAYDTKYEICCGLRV